MKPCAKWVRLEDEHGTLSLVSKRANCGAVTRYSPSKKAKIDELMDQTPRSFSRNARTPAIMSENLITSHNQYNDDTLLASSNDQPL